MKIMESNVGTVVKDNIMEIWLLNVKMGVWEKLSIECRDLKMLESPSRSRI